MIIIFLEKLAYFPKVNIPAKGKLSVAKKMNYWFT